MLSHTLLTHSLGAARPRWQRSRGGPLSSLSNLITTGVGRCGWVCLEIFMASRELGGRDTSQQTRNNNSSGVASNRRVRSTGPLVPIAALGPPLQMSVAQQK
jgi:hypothetical protein